MVTIKQYYIKLLIHVKILVDISVQFQKIPISDIANFTISAADILPIQYMYWYTSNIWASLLKYIRKSYQF